MTRDTIPEILSALAFCAIAVLLLNPLDFWMPSMAHMTVLAVGAAAFGAFAIFVLRERAGDERDEAHRALAGRAAFLAGSGVLILAIALQSMTYEVDSWLVWALIAMVLAKIGVRIWSTLYR